MVALRYLTPKFLKVKFLPHVATTIFFRMKKGLDHYLLCLIATQPQNGLNVFHDDLYQFSEEIQVLLINTSRSEDSFSQISEVLPHWYDTCVRYLSRVIQILGFSNLSVLIHAVLIGKKIVVKPSKHSGDIARFVRLLQRQENIGYGDNPDVEKPNVEKTKSKYADGIVHVNFVEQVEPQKNCASGNVLVTISSTETNQFCVSWAQRLCLQVLSPESSSSPLQLHSEIVTLKNQLNGQLKSIHQRISDARSDYYALYRAYLELKENPNQDMLLERLLQEVGRSNNTQMREVLQAIYNFNSKLNHMDD